MLLRLKHTDKNQENQNHKTTKAETSRWSAAPPRCGVRTLSHLSVPADLDLLRVVPGVEDVLGAVEGNALLLNPLHTEDSS